MGPWEEGRECVGAYVAWCDRAQVHAATRVCTCLRVREIDMGMDMHMHTSILYVHTHVTWSVKGARDAEACQGLCVCVCWLGA